MRKQISEPEFRDALWIALDAVSPKKYDFIIGPGRSGAIAAAYASHMHGIPFAAWDSNIPAASRVLIIDTAAQTGKTIRKAYRRYTRLGHKVKSVAVYSCPKTHFVFWYEANPH